MNNILTFILGIGVSLSFLAHAQTAGNSINLNKAKPMTTSSSLGRRQLKSDFKISEDRKVKVAFFDADSTLRITRSGQITPVNPEDVMVLPRVAEKLKKLSDAGYLLAIV